jgi:hypothetical protein
MNCEALRIEESYQGTYFEHAFSKACQYVIVDEKVYRGLKHVFIKFAQVDLQKCIIWPKKFGKENKNGIRLA